MGKWHRVLLGIVSILALVGGWWANVPAAEVEAQGTIARFATLPDRSPGHPEGLTADGDGNIYAASFELNPSTGCQPQPTLNWFPPARSGLITGDLTCPFQQNYIYVYSQSGQLKTSLPMPAGVVPLGMVTTATDLYVNDVFNGDLLRYTLPVTSTSTPVRTYNICGGFVVAFGAPGDFCGLNANDVGPDGRIYMSDNGAGPSVVGPPGFLRGRIFVVDPETGASSVFFANRELNVAGFPEFGVNGVAFAPDGSALFMANMSTSKIFRLTLSSCASSCIPGTFALFIQGNGIHGPDNIDFDDQGNLWIASGQNDQVVAVNPAGQVIRRIGAIQGFTNEGAPRGLFQPSGIKFSKGIIYVGNESNVTLRPPSDAGLFGGLRAFTLSRITP